MTAPLISVVVPVFNAERYLAECLESVFADAPAGVEVVVVDDGSTDSSESILRTYAKTHAALQIHRRENAGPAAARNFGLAQARGKYIWFVDADDVIKPGAWREACAALEAEPDIAIHNGERFGGESAARRFFEQPKPSGALSGGKWIEVLCAQREFHHLVYLHLYRREFLLRHALRFLEGILHEDIGWVTESYLCAQRVVYADRVLYGYRRNPASLTGSGEDAKLMRRIESYFTVVPQLRGLNERYAPQGDLMRALKAEVVAQGLQVDRLAARLASDQLRDAVRTRCKKERFWAGLWSDAATFKSKRQLAKVMLREFLRQPAKPERRSTT